MSTLWNGIGRYLWMLGWAVVLTACIQESYTPINKGAQEQKDSTTLDGEGLEDLTIAEGEDDPYQGRFVDFVIRDRPQILFVDEKGDTTAFLRCEDEAYPFQQMLPAPESNSSNQGVGPNKALLNQKFRLTYELREEAVRLDGSIGEVKIITKVEELE